MSQRYVKLKPLSGFTLPELMIVLVFIAIIAAISIPNYTSYIRDNYRSEAQTLMSQISVTLDSVLTTNGRLVGSGGPFYTLTEDLGYACFPEGSTCGTSAVRYTMSLSFPDAESYTITFTPAGSQINDACSLPALVLNSQNQKTPVQAAGEDCWP